MKGLGSFYKLFPFFKVVVDVPTAEHCQMWMCVWGYPTLCVCVIEKSWSKKKKKKTLEGAEKQSEQEIVLLTHRPIWYHLLFTFFTCFFFLLSFRFAKKRKYMK